MNEPVTTSVWQKLGASALNVSVILGVTVPIALGLKLSFHQARVLFLLVSAVYLAVALFTPRHRSLGMMVAGLDWREPYSLARLARYAILYLLSLSTLLFWIWVPFDLFLANILLIQLPCVLLTGTTLHGFLSGGVTTAKLNTGTC